MDVGPSSPPRSTSTSSPAGSPSRWANARPAHRPVRPTGQARRVVTAPFSSSWTDQPSLDRAGKTSIGGIHPQLDLSTGSSEVDVLAYCDRCEVSRLYPRLDSPIESDDCDKPTRIDDLAGLVLASGRIFLYRLASCGTVFLACKDFVHPVLPRSSWWRIDIDALITPKARAGFYQFRLRAVDADEREDQNRVRFFRFMSSLVCRTQKPCPVEVVGPAFQDGEASNDSDSLSPFHNPAAHDRPPSSLSATSANKPKAKKWNLKGGVWLPDNESVLPLEPGRRNNLLAPIRPPNRQQRVVSAPAASLTVSSHSWSPALAEKAKEQHATVLASTEFASQANPDSDLGPDENSGDGAPSVDMPGSSWKLTPISTAVGSVRTPASATVWSVPQSATTLVSSTTTGTLVSSAPETPKFENLTAVMSKDDPGDISGQSVLEEGGLAAPVLSAGVLLDDQEKLAVESSFEIGDDDGCGCEPADQAGVEDLPRISRTFTDSCIDNDSFERPDERGQADRIGGPSFLRRTASTVFAPPAHVLSAMFWLARQIVDGIDHSALVDENDGPTDDSQPAHAYPTRRPTRRVAMMGGWYDSSSSSELSATSDDDGWAERALGYDGFVYQPDSPAAAGPLLDLCSGQPSGKMAAIDGQVEPSSD